MGWKAEGSEFESLQRQDFFLISASFRPLLEPIPLLIQWVPEALSLGIKRLERESFPTRADVKNT
jgi:hypothetical protein